MFWSSLWGQQCPSAERGEPFWQLGAVKCTQDAISVTKARQFPWCTSKQVLQDSGDNLAETKKQHWSTAKKRLPHYSSFCRGVFICFVSSCSTMKPTRGLALYVLDKWSPMLSYIPSCLFTSNFKAVSCQLPRLALPKFPMRPRHRQTLNMVLLCQPPQDECHQA